MLVILICTYMDTLSSGCDGKDHEKCWLMSSQSYCRRFDPPCWLLPSFLFVPVMEVAWVLVAGFGMDDLLEHALNGRTSESSGPQLDSIPGIATHS